MSESTESTQPVKTVKKRAANWRAILLTILVALVVFALSVFSGYQYAMSSRMNAQQSTIQKQLMEQYQYALVDIQFARYDAAKQRLDFIIANNPNYPGASQTLTDLLVKMSIPTSTPTLVPTPTPNPSGAQGTFATAQQYIAAQDWANALAALDQVRKEDSTYQTVQVDGMYYFALRNYGYDMILKQGNLEGGIYELTLAERFGPLDNTASGLREGARAYLTASSFYGINWQQAVQYLSQVASGWPSMWDGTMTAAQRYQIASMRYGDQLVSQGQYCAAVTQYTNASTIGNLDTDAAKGYNQAYKECYPATGTVAPTSAVVATATTGGGSAPTATTGAPAATNTPVPSSTPAPPTDTPTP